MKNELFGKDEKLYIRTSYNNTVKVHEVIRGWESFNGWYWFAVELSHKQDSILNPICKDGKFVSGTEIENDKIYYGLVQGSETEWGYFSEGEINELIKKLQAWEIPKENLPFSGRRD